MADMLLTSTTPRRPVPRSVQCRDWTGVTIPLQWYGRYYGADCLSRTWAMVYSNGVPRLFILAPTWMSPSALLTDISAPLVLTDFAAHHQVRTCTCMLPLAKPVRFYNPQHSCRSVRLRRLLADQLFFVLPCFVPLVTYYRYPPRSLWSEAIPTCTHD